MTQTIKSTTDLIGKKIVITIKDPERYTSDLYNSIEGQIGTITQNANEKSLCYDNAYLVKFDNKVTSKYAKTHSGKWGAARNKMEWWIERNDFKLF